MKIYVETEYTEAEFDNAFPLEEVYDTDDIADWGSEDVFADYEVGFDPYMGCYSNDC